MYPARSLQVSSLAVHSPCEGPCYRSARPSFTLRVTAAMKAGVTDHVWLLDELTGGENECHQGSYNSS